MTIAPSLISLLLAALVVLPFAAQAEPVTVRNLEGTLHGFLVLRSLGGKTLASGDLIQTLRDGRVYSHLVFLFKDGSVDDEASVFSQQGKFRLISDHHIQKGPAFPHPLDTMIDAQTGEVTVRYSDGGKTKVARRHLDLPNDLANGIILDVLKNIQPDIPQTKLSYVASDPEPRLVKLAIAPQGEETFLVGGAHRKATRFRVKVELGGLAGFIAPLVGKEPGEVSVWVLGGEAPTFVKLQGPLYLAGPTWVIEMAIPVWPQVEP